MFHHPFPGSPAPAAAPPLLSCSMAASTSTHCCLWATLSRYCILVLPSRQDKRPLVEFRRRLSHRPTAALVRPCRAPAPAPAPAPVPAPPLYCTALHCTAGRRQWLARVDCWALRCTALHCISLHCIALHCIALNCIALHRCDLQVLCVGQINLPSKIYVEEFMALCCLLDIRYLCFAVFVPFCICAAQDRPLCPRG
jgi:hypothetical protein